MDDVFGDGTAYEVTLGKPRRKWYAWHDATWMIIGIAVFVAVLLAITWK